MYELRLVLFVLNGNSGSVEGDFMHASFLKVSCVVVKKHSLNKSKSLFVYKELFFVISQVVMILDVDARGKKAQKSALQPRLFMLLGIPPAVFLLFVFSCPLALWLSG